MKKYLARLTAALLTLTLLISPASALTVEQALELLEENFYYDIPEEAYQADTVDQLMDLLDDPYTQYMDPETYQLFLDLVEDTVDLVGIGVQIEGYGEDGMHIKTVFPGGAAEEAGLVDGDLIVAIDGVSCVPSTQQDRDRILGEEGSLVTLTVLRDGQRLSIPVTRRQIYIPNTSVALLESGAGYIDCSSFGMDTAGLMAAGVEAFDDEVSCWILDLRDNTGGYVSAALDMMGALNGPGGYLFFEERGNEVTPYASMDWPVTKKPLIVLVNGDSASASELVSGNVRDTMRGVVVGSRTFGKGVAQSILNEENSPEYFDGDCLKVTTARFYTASGNTTDKVGVIPTLLVEDGYTSAVAAALAGGSKESSTLCVIPSIYPFYVDPDAPDVVLRALLEALPPTIPLFYSGTAGGTFQQVTPAQAAEALGLDFDSRWFTDVADSAYAAEINSMGAYELLNGTAPGLFSPKEQLTRAQLCVMLARVLNVDGGASRFSDVADDAWYAGGVNAMAELGLVDGVGGGKFDPESPLTQEQFLTIMGRMARFLNFGLDLYGRMLDDPEAELSDYAQLTLSAWSDWAQSSVALLAWGVDRRDMLFAPLSQLNPSAPVLREEAAAGMYKVLSVLEILP